jgi:hypothetical protein
VTNPPARGVSHISNMGFFEGLNEGVTNVTNPPPRGLVTLVTWDFLKV